MATRVNGNKVTIPQSVWYNKAVYLTPYFYYTVATNNATTYTLTLYAGVKTCMPGGSAATRNIQMQISGTGQTTKSNSKPVIFGPSDTDTTVIASFSWSWAKTHAAQTKTVTATIKSGVPKNTASKSFTIPAKTSYKITYNANGGSGAPGQQTKWYGENLTLSTTKPTRTGYTFKGWSTSSTATSASYSAGGTYTANAAATLYAVWTPNVYNITLDYKDATAGSTTVYEKYNTGIYKEQACTNKMTTTTNAITKPQRTGYTFGGYWTGENGSGTQLIADTGFITSNFGTTRYTGSATLYAKWTANEYHLRFNPNGGIGEIQTQDFIYDTGQNLITVADLGYNRQDYTFIHWNESFDDSGKEYSDGVKVTGAIPLGTADLYAIWQYNYSQAQIQSLNAYRVGDDNLEDDVNGTRVKINAQFALSLKYNTKDKVPVNVYVRYCESGEQMPDRQPGDEPVGREIDIDNFECIIGEPGENLFDTETQYDILIETIPVDNGEEKTAEATSAKRLTYITKAKFILDINQDQSAVGILAPAPDHTYQLTVDTSVVTGKQYYERIGESDPYTYKEVKNPGAEQDINPSEKGWYEIINDVSGVYIGTNNLIIKMSNEGTKGVYIDAPNIWREAIGLSPVEIEISDLTFNQCSNATHTKVYRYGNLVVFSFNINVTTATSGYSYISGLPKSIATMACSSSGANNVNSRWYINTNGELVSDNVPATGYHNGNITYITNQM